MPKSQSWHCQFGKFFYIQLNSEIVSNPLFIFIFFFAAECDEFYANSVLVISEFGGNNYNAPLFAGEALEDTSSWRMSSRQSLIELR